MHIVFIEPRFPANQKQFIKALAEVGATVTAIGEGSKESLDGDLRHWLTHYEQVGNVTDDAQMLQAVRWIQKRARIDRLEATVEAHIMTAARVREACGIPGTSVRTAYLCRDKPAMKEVLRKGGVPCARSTAASSLSEVRTFVDEVGLPVILKPRDGAGAAGAVRIEQVSELEPALIALGAGRPNFSVAVEEFIDGHEGFYDTMAIKGKVAHDFVCHYYPNVLQAMRTRWISPQLVTSNRIDSAPAYREVQDMGQRVIELLGIETSATHMEWFSGSKGLKFSEIGCRPPGVRAWDLYNVGNDMDLYREWAMAICWSRASQRASRRMSAGLIALRPDCDGRIVGYEGTHAIAHAFGSSVIDFYLPPIGTPTQAVSAGYMANAWLRLKHENYDELRRMLDVVGQTVQVRAR